MSLPQTISSSPRRQGRFSPGWPEKVPIIVAEALDEVTDPLHPWLRPERRAGAAEVVAAITRALARPEDPRPLPEWLVDHQRPLVRRLLPMLSRHGGALLAAPIGSGKTYVALATAALWSRSPAIALVPAVLVSQWQGIAAALGLEIVTWSHERLSRGRLPESLIHRTECGLVIIDESHHFRNAASLRYRHLAPALSGHAVLLVSATPVVNRLADLASQLLLGIRDDRLNPFGIPSLREHLRNSPAAHPAVGTLILTSPDDLQAMPSRRDRRARAEADNAELESISTGIDSLVLSRNPAIASLIRTVLWRAMASSPAALAGALRRYHGLLLHAREAMESGRALDRAGLRRFVGNAPDQLIFWELLPNLTAPTDLDPGDLIAVEDLHQRARDSALRPDEKVMRLAQQLTDGRKTIVFSSARETVRYLREHLAAGPIAWCTGEAAGIGHTHLPRDAVLQWFTPGRSNGKGPRVLVATDVAAEGLNLQAAERVVHYDLPWTAVRLDQRDGRTLRLGSEHESVEVIRFDPPAVLAGRLRQISILAGKRVLPRRAGLVGASARTWHWRDRIAEGTLAQSRRGRWAAVRGDLRGVLVGFTIVTEHSEASRELASVIGWLDDAGKWSEQPELIDQILAATRHAAELADPPAELLEEALRQVSPIVRDRLDAVCRSRWAAPAIGSAAARLIARLNRLIVQAARERDGVRLGRLERALRFAARGHTAGEEHWIEVLLGLPDALAYQQLQRCPPPDADLLPRVRLNGMVIFTPTAQSGITVSS